MKTIAVTGGKGGTGKSTFAILFAFKELLKGKKVLLVDCDVECPNDYLILGVSSLEKPSRKTFAYYPRIDRSKCNNCGICVKSCRSNAIIHARDKFPKIHKDLCSSCGVCWTICPRNAISKKKTINGNIYKKQIEENLTLLTGISKPGVRETSPVVRQTKEFVEEEITEDFDLCIIDTAAGTHCTVMSALEGADEAYAVTEPTPVGAHDLNIILNVLKVMKIPSKIVVNQFDIGDMSKIEKIAEQNAISISMKIPYNRELAEAYSSGDFLGNRELVKLLD